MRIWRKRAISNAAQPHSLIAACKQPAISQVLLEQPKFMGIDRLDATGITVRMAIKTKPGEHWAVLRELRLAVTRLLAERGIHLYGPVAGSQPG